MKHFKHVFGALMRDMLFLHGHFVTFQGLDGAAQRSRRPQPPQLRERTDRAPHPSRATMADEEACCVH